MSLDGDVDVGMLLQELCVGLQGALIGRAYVGLVVVEEDVLHVLREEFFFGCVGGSGRRWRGSRVDGHASGGVLCAAGALGDEMVSGRVGRSNLARAANVNRPDAVDADVGGV